MKKTLLLSLSLTSVAISAQHFCGYDHKKAELEAQFPEIKQERENAEMQLQLMGGAANQLKAMGIKPTGNSLMATSQKIYEIPVVVHIIESKNSKDATSKLHLTDEQIQQWIENANKMYATTYGGQYYPEGTGIEGGTVIPVKLVLAKRSPNCEATNGIVRHDASSLEGYNDHGVRSSNATGATEAQVVAFAPQWDTKAYYNMYIVDSFDGNTAGWGLMGYAYYPMSSKYYTFMKASVVTKPNDSTLAHEFAHSMGLDHVFQGANSNGGECPPSTGDETVDNDKVADTEPIQSLLSVNPTPGNDVINPCTNRNYEGGQYNIMNYTFTEKKFTPGQRDRALALFLQYRSSLVNNSLALTEPGTPIETAEATCNPKDIANKGYYRMGPINVSLGTINNTTGNYLPGENNFYVDYTQTTCTVSNVFTDIKANEASTVSVKIDNNNPQFIKVWIDYNNNGTFETDEQISTTTSRTAAGGTYTATFTPPASAVKNTYLRMRVRADFNNGGACDNLGYGQVEDYAVRITDDSKLSTNEQNTTKESVFIYSKTDNKLKLVGDNPKQFGAYQIYDISGKLVQDGVSNTNEISLKSNLSKGVYIIKYANKTSKFIY